jgi:hypothetical protein
VVFEREFTIVRDAAQDRLLFRAETSSPQWEWPRRGLFRLNTQGALETLIVENVGMTGARDVSFTSLSSEVPRQTVGGTTAFAVHDEQGWMIYRSQPVRDARGQPVTDSRGNPTFQTTLIVREGQPLADGRRLKTLNASPLVSPTNDLYRSGPIFTLNDAGDVAFFASDGQRWGVYELSDRS